MKHFLSFALPLLLIAAACQSSGPQSQSLSIDYPNADVVTINLNTTAGQVTVNPSDTAGVHGTVTTNVSAWQANNTTSGSSISIAQGSSGADVIPNAQNTWDLQFGKGKALILNHTNTAANTILNLGGLMLTQLNVTATSGDYTLRYDTPNPANDGGTASLQLTGGTVDAAGLVNSHLNSLAITTGGGDVSLSFDGGTLTQNMSVTINTQDGDVLVKIPAGIAAQITYNSPSGTAQEVDPQFTKVNKITYTVGNYAAATSPHVTIDFRSVVGDLRLAGE